jgi:predicted DNA-binding protein
MATKNPRINVVMEESLYQGVKRLARRDGTSISTAARDLIKEALADLEDAFWTEVAEEREKSFSEKKALSHDKLWGER